VLLLSSQQSGDLREGGSSRNFRLWRTDGATLLSSCFVLLILLSCILLLHSSTLLSSPKYLSILQRNATRETKALVFTGPWKTRLYQSDLFYEATTPHDQTRRCRRAYPKGLHWVSASSARSTMQLKMFDLDPCAGEQQLHHPSSRKSTDFCLKGTASANTLPQKL
jgi:hypothetical protein